MDLYSYDAARFPKCSWRTSNGLGQTLIQILKYAICIISSCCKVVRLSQARGNYLLALEIKDLLKDLLGAGGIPMNWQ
jgi:hypothetical protein